MKQLSKELVFKNRILKVIRGDAKPVLGLGNGYIDVTNYVKDGVECNKCRKLHVIGENTNKINFLTIIGNVHANNGGGLLGNSDWDEHGVPTHNYCPKCLIEEIEDWTEEERKC